MTNLKNLQNHFIIAMPRLVDPNFFHTVTYVCEHNENGVLGFTINRPSGIVLSEIFDQMSIESDSIEAKSQPVFTGGPLQMEQGFVIHRNSGHWQSSLKIENSITLTTSRDILKAIALDEGPKENIVLLGYSCWNTGQLEEEITQDTWLVGPSDPNIIFDLPVEQRWQAAGSLIGVDMNNISPESGHA